MKGAIAYLQRRRADDPLVAEYSAVIAEEVDRLSDFVSDFLLYARQSGPRKAPCDINQLLQSVLTLLAGQLAARGVTVDLQLEDELPEIDADPQQLQQVFLNVLINAMDAMAEGGPLRIATTLVEEEGGSRLQITVADNGAGIAAADLPYVFDPFYSTKDNGTGLGLPISMSIIANHDGQFRIDSPPGEGCTVVIDLPCPPARRELLPGSAP
jgi:signal transduction histidine kinase